MMKVVISVIIGLYASTAVIVGYIDSETYTKKIKNKWNYGTTILRSTFIGIFWLPFIIGLAIGQIWIILKNIRSREAKRVQL